MKKYKNAGINPYQRSLRKDCNFRICMLVIGLMGSGICLVLRSDKITSWILSVFVSIMTWSMIEVFTFTNSFRKMYYKDRKAFYDEFLLKLNKLKECFKINYKKDRINWKQVVDNIFSIYNYTVETYNIGSTFGFSTEYQNIYYYCKRMFYVAIQIQSHGLFDNKGVFRNREEEEKYIKKFVSVEESYESIEEFTLLQKEDRRRNSLSVDFSFLPFVFPAGYYRCDNKGDIEEVYNLISETKPQIKVTKTFIPKTKMQKLIYENDEKEIRFTKMIKMLRHELDPEEWVAQKEMQKHEKGAR